MPVRMVMAAGIAAALAGCAGTPEEAAGPSSDTLASRGYDAYNRGEYLGAASYFEDALALDPDNAFAAKGLDAARDGVAHFGARRPTDRDTPMEKAIYRASLQGYEAYKRGDLADAAARFRAILAIAPGDAYATKGLAAVRRKAGQRGGEEGGSPVAVPPVYSAVPVPEAGIFSYDAPEAAPPTN